MSIETEENLCSICGAVLPERRPGINDAWPVSAGKCCDACNAIVVVPARIELEKSAMRQLEDQIAKGFPSSAAMKTPSRNAPAFSHFEMSRRMIGSAIRWATMRRSH